MPEKHHAGDHIEQAVSSTRKSSREVDGIFFSGEQLNNAISALTAAGFSCADMTAVLERHVGGGHRVAVTSLPDVGVTQADERQVRTLATSLSGAAGALAAAGITIATGGAAVAAVAAATLVGGSAATGVYVLKTLAGFDGVVPEEDVILSVSVKTPDDERRVLDLFQRHGAVQIWARNRPRREASGALPDKPSTVRKQPLMPKERPSRRKTVRKGTSSQKSL
jgi:hypothetical protein